MINVKKIELYLNRTLLGKIIKLNKNLIKNSDTLSIYYFY